MSNRAAKVDADDRQRAAGARQRLKMTNQTWNVGTVVRLVENTKNREEHAWHLIPSLRRALLAETALGVVSNLDRETIVTGEVHALFVDMCNVADVDL